MCLSLAENCCLCPSGLRRQDQDTKGATLPTDIDPNQAMRSGGQPIIAKQLGIGVTGHQPKYASITNGLIHS